MSKLNIAAALAAVAIAATAPLTLAQTTPKTDAASPAESARGYGMGGSMMGGYGQGGGGSGPGMMGGYPHGQGGHGPGMMGGQGPGMMGGHGPGMMGGHGPGMMGGHGQGMMGDGAGRMRGHGGGKLHGYGAGMMGMGFGMYYALDLTDEQRIAVAQIREEVRKKNWDTLGKLIEAGARLRDLYAAAKHDPAAIGQQTVTIAELRRPIVESMVEARDRVDALLTKEQKERLRASRRGRMMGDQ